MTNLKTIVPVLALTATLSACGMFGKDQPKAQAAQPAPAVQQQAQQQAPQTKVQAPQTVQVDSIDGKKEVAYKCGNKNPLHVMYGFKNGEVVIAQVKYLNKLSPGLFRVTGNQDSNMFTGNGITWVAEKANAANVDKVNGNMLTQEGIETVNGKQHQVSQIVARSCVLDKAATAKLNKQAKK